MSPTMRPRASPIQSRFPGGGQIYTANDTATDPTTINQLPDLTVAKSHTGDFTQGQAGATYSITVTNSGFAATTGGRVSYRHTSR